jgi:hypothetical protein
VFDIEGVEKVGSGGVGFSSDNVEFNAVAPVNGNVKFTVTPKTGNGEWGTGNREELSVRVFTFTSNLHLISWSRRSRNAHCTFE